jgi:hypothetical protein
MQDKIAKMIYNPKYWSDLIEECKLGLIRQSVQLCIGQQWI